MPTTGRYLKVGDQHLLFDNADAIDAWITALEALRLEWRTPEPPTPEPPPVIDVTPVGDSLEDLYGSNLIRYQITPGELPATIVKSCVDNAQGKAVVVDVSDGEVEAHSHIVTPAGMTRTEMPFHLNMGKAAFNGRLVIQNRENVQIHGGLWRIGHPDDTKFNVIHITNAVGVTLNAFIIADAIAGLGVSVGSKAIVAKNGKIFNCRKAGYGIHCAQNVLFEDMSIYQCDLDYQADPESDKVGRGGGKIGHSKDVVFRRVKSRKNKRGGWLDNNIEDFRAEYCDFEDNHLDGWYVEVGAKATFVNTHFRRNGGHGVNLAVYRDVTLDGCDLSDNLKEQLLVSGATEGRDYIPVPGAWLPQQRLPKTGRLDLLDNTLRGELLFKFTGTGWTAFKTNTIARGNDWQSDTAQPIQMDGNRWRSVDEWRTEMGDEVD